MDAKIGRSQRLTGVVNVFPEFRKSVNLDTFTPPESTFDQHQGTLGTILTHTAVAGDSLVVASSIALDRYDARIEPNGDQIMTLTPSGVGGSHFAAAAPADPGSAVGRVRVGPGPAPGGRRAPA